MGQDVYGNYQATLVVPADSPINNGVIGRGAGVPDVNTPLYFLGYIDSNTGNFYINQTGLASGWVLAGGGAAGSQVIKGAFANPNGNVTPSTTTSGAIYYQDSVTPNIWSWSVANQNWQQVIGV